MFGFVNVVGATLRETTRTANNNGSETRKPAQAAGKPVKAKP